MKVDLTSIYDETTHYLDVDTEISMDISHIVGGVDEKIKIKASIFRTEEGLLLEGVILYNFKDYCSRCLKEVITEIESNITTLITEHEHEIIEFKPEDITMVLYKDGELFIRDIVKESILLSIPMKTICEENCKGICVRCGVNLNKEKCTCDKEEIDPRLAELKKLIK